MMLENIEVLSLNTDGYCRRNLPSGQSILFVPERSGHDESSKSHCFVVRPMVKEFHGFSPDEEIRLRIASHNLHRRHIPQTLPTDFAVVQVRNEKSLPAIMKLMPYAVGAKPITEIEISDLVSDPRVCSDIARINFGYLMMMVREGIYTDMGVHSTGGERIKDKLTRSLRCVNIVVGEINGEARAFPDSDWSFDNTNPLVSTPLKRTKFAAKAVTKLLFYGAASVRGRIRNKLSSHHSPL